MHICHCFKDFSLAEGGIERNIGYLSRAALKTGYKITALVSRPKGASAMEIVNDVQEIRTKPLFKIFKVPIMPDYYRCLAEINPDIVHAHGTVPNVSDVAIYYAWKHNKPSLFNYAFDGNAESKLGSIFADIYNGSINLSTVKRASKVTATSYSYAESSPVLRHILNRIEVIPRGVELDRFNPAIDTGNIKEKYNIPPGKTIFFAGRFVKYKGLEYLLRAMKHVEQGTLIIAGKGEEELRLKKLVHDLNIINVKFIGLISHQELPRLYKASDVYVLPSISRGENFGIAALEAMACGTPVVASDLPGVRELVTDESGIKIKPKDIIGIANAINTVLSDDNLRSRMSLSARKNAENYSWETITEKVLRIYEDLKH